MFFWGGNVLPPPPMPPEEDGRDAAYLEPGVETDVGSTKIYSGGRPAG